MTEIVDQPPSVPNARPHITDLVIADLLERKAVGIARYGTPLQAFNHRNGLVDLYQELQDGVLYVRQVIEEGTHLADHLEAAWGLIANANWELQSEEWRLAAARWRDEWLAYSPRTE